MRVYRSIQILTIPTLLAAFAACHSSDSGASAQTDSAAGTALAADPAPAAAPAPTPAPAPAPATNIAVDVHWDSGPLDLAYHNAHVALEAQHAREVAKPRADETPTQRTRRQAEENQALEVRYTNGKASHARKLPPS